MTPKTTVQCSSEVLYAVLASYIYTSCSYTLSTHQHYNNMGLKLLVHYILNGSGKQDQTS